MQTNLTYNSASFFENNFTKHLALSHFVPLVPLSHFVPPWDSGTAGQVGQWDTLQKKLAITYPLKLNSVSHHGGESSAGLRCVFRIFVDCIQSLITDNS